MRDTIQQPGSDHPPITRLQRLGSVILFGHAGAPLAWADLERYKPLLCACALAILHAPLLLWLRDIWASPYIHDTMLSVATPAVILGLLYLRRGDVAALKVPSDVRHGAGLALIAASASIAICAIAMGTALPLAISAPMAIHGYLYWTRGPLRASAILSPVYMLIFLVPGTHGQLASLSDALQIASAQTATFALQGLGFPSTRDGILITTGDTLNYVTESCSGMTTLTALLLYGLVLSYLMRLTARQTLISVSSLLPMALVANGGRIAFISYLLYAHSYELAMGPLHDISAYVGFAVAYGALFLLMRRMARHNKANQASAEAASHQLPSTL